MIAIELAIFTFVLLAIWWVRRRQLRSLVQQEMLLRRFAEGVTTWRGKAGVPVEARQAVEMLVDMPLGRRVVWHFAIEVMKNPTSPKLDDNPFWRIRQQLNVEQREAFDWIMVTFFLIFTYSDWFAGALIRRMRFGGLSQQTQAEVAVETVFSRGMGQASHVAAA